MLLNAPFKPYNFYWNIFLKNSLFLRYFPAHDCFDYFPSKCIRYKNFERNRIRISLYWIHFISIGNFRILYVPQIALARVHPSGILNLVLSRSFLTHKWRTICESIVNRSPRGRHFLQRAALSATIPKIALLHAREKEGGRLSAGGQSDIAVDFSLSLSSSSFLLSVFVTLDNPIFRASQKYYSVL